MTTKRTKTPKVQTQRSAAKVDRASKPTPADANVTPRAPDAHDDGRHHSTEASSSTNSAAEIPDALSSSTADPEALRQPADVTPTSPSPAMRLPESLKPKRTLVASYVYKDEFGQAVYRVQRYLPKDFRPQHLDSKGSWRAGLNGTRRLPYGADRLARLKGAMIYLCEGEKDTETAWRIGLNATCCSGGANGWKAEFAAFFDGNYVVILPHNDDAGRTFAATAAAHLVGHALDLVILPLPGLEEKGDLTDFVEAGGTTADVLRLSQEAFQAIRPATANLDADDPTPATAAATKEGDGKPPLWKLKRQCFSDITPETMEWLWPNVWLDGAVNLLTGSPGLGKTFVAADLAARISTGHAWPDGSGKAPLGDVVFMSAEDSYASVLVHRVKAAGGNTDRVFCWPTKFQTKEDGSVDEIEITLEDIDYIADDIESMPGLKLVIFDPVTSYLGSADANDNAEVRRVLGRLVKLAEAKRFAVLLITHDKKMNVAAINSPMGSTAFTALPRVVQGLYRDTTDDQKKKRILSPIKNNHGDDRFSRTFDIDIPSGDSRRSHIVWHEALDDRSADEVRAESLKSLAGFGREQTEESTTKKRQLKILGRLDSLTGDQEGWVPKSEILKTMSMGGGVFTETIFDMMRENIIEEKSIDKELPNGGIVTCGQKAIRRKRHSV